MKSALISLMVTWILSGSPEPNFEFLEQIVKEIRQDDLIYAVDKGLELCRKYNIAIDKVVGDMDSLDLRYLQDIDPKKITRFDQDKDKSDTALALDIAIKQQNFPIFLVNATGGRPDHYFMNLALLIKYPDVVRMLTSHGTLWGLRPNHHYRFQLPLKSLFSLLPWGPIEELTIKGALYNLENVNLAADSVTLTLSNVVEQDLAINFHAGALIIFSETSFRRGFGG